MTCREGRSTYPPLGHPQQYLPPQPVSDSVRARARDHPKSHAERSLCPSYRTRRRPLCTLNPVTKQVKFDWQERANFMEGIDVGRSRQLEEHDGVLSAGRTGVVTLHKP